MKSSEFDKGIEDFVSNTARTVNYAFNTKPLIQPMRFYNAKRIEAAMITAGYPSEAMPEMQFVSTNINPDRFPEPYVHITYRFDKTVPPEVMRNFAEAIAQVFGDLAQEVIYNVPDWQHGSLGSYVKIMLSDKYREIYRLI